MAVASRLLTSLVAARYGRYIPTYARGRLVDLGCGKVPLYGTYRDHVSSVVCVDWEQSPHQLRHADILCDLAGPLPLESHSFETIILSDTLEHVADPWLLWGEMRRILVAGGRVLLSVPFMYWIHERPHDYFRYTRFALERMAHESGFDTLLLEALGGSPEVVVDMLARHVSLVPTIGARVAAVLQRAAHRLSGLRAVRELSRASAEYYPLAYFMVVERRVAS